MEKKGIHWWRTPPESLDLNPIENMWHELKEYIRREVKPQTKEQVINGIEEFWRTVDAQNARNILDTYEKSYQKLLN